MKSTENEAEVETVAKDKQPINDKKEEVGRNVDAFQGWVTTGSAWFRSAK
ncbi:unnamed protein product, partial [Brugia timori]